MKKIVACLLSLLLLLSSAMAEVSFQKLPEDISNIPLDMQHPIDNMNKGAWMQMADLGETLFPLYYYAPETSKICEKAIFIVLDSGVKAEDFLNESGWLELADKKNVSLVLVENQEGWATDAQAVEKVARAFAICKTRRYYDFSWDIIDLVGYGEGATVAMKYNMSAPDGFAAVLLFGGEAMTEAYMNEMRSTPSEDEGKMLSQIPCPVWRFVDEMTPALKAEVEYWKQANNNADTVYASQYADYVYMPSYIWHGLQFENQNISQTRVTVGKHVDGTGAAFLEDLYDEFLWMYARHRGVGAQDVRYYVNPEDYGMDFYSAEVEGMVRTWYVYVPEKVKRSGEAAPLVLALAGRGGSYNTFASLTQWPQIANERGFICVFPMASFGRQVSNGIGNVPMWTGGSFQRGGRSTGGGSTGGGSTKGNGTGAGRTRGGGTASSNAVAVPKVDDVAFIRYLIEDVKANYPIDGGRVYASGQSMGSMMAISLSVTLADVVTATASTCGALQASALESPHYSEEYACPAWLIYGEEDHTVGSYKISESASVKTCIEYYIQRYGLTDVDHAQTYRSGPYSHYVFTNEQDVPMFRYTVVDAMGHANTPNESYLMYDEFFSKFYRDEAGVLHYMESDDVLDIR